MRASIKELQVRLALAATCLAALGFLYVRALAGAALSGHFTMFAHPWVSVPADLLMFLLCAASLVSLSTFLSSGSRLQRSGALLLAMFPAWVIIHFLWWALR